MHKFSSIDAFYQVRRYVSSVNRKDEVPEEYKINEPVSYRGTVKLHGTNSGVVHTSSGDIVCQSRSRVISPEVDNAGFAAFIEKNKETVLEICNEIRESRDISKDKKLVIYGEWIGPGIQKGMAINNLSKRQWVIFAVKIADENGESYIDCKPSFGDRFKEQDIFSVFDVATWELTVDFSDTKSCEAAISKFDKLTDEVEQECPWGKKFGFSGLGEGIVWVPTGKHWGNPDLFFKTKGEKHKETKTKDSKSQIDPETLKSINDFIDFSLTENRLNHGLEAIKEVGFEVEPKSIGHYLKWIGNDVQRECRLELEDNNLEWKTVSKAINERAKKFFLDKIKEGLL